MPLAFLLYLSAYLDRGNLGNAKVQGLVAAVLDGDDEKYSLVSVQATSLLAKVAHAVPHPIQALSFFYISYILLSIPGTLLAKAIDPSISISIGAMIWAVAASSQAGVQNPAG
jgi:hypothetical protein